MTTDAAFRVRDSLQDVWTGMQAQSEAERAESLSVMAAEGPAVIARFDVAHAVDSTDREYLNATLSLLALEASARLGVMASAGETNEEAAERLIGGVGGALDAAVSRFEQRDMAGALEFLGAATNTLGLGIGLPP